MKNRTLTLILCLTAYALAGSYLFAQSQGPANVWTSGTNKGKFSNPLIVPANSGTGADQFANGADTESKLGTLRIQTVKELAGLRLRLRRGASAGFIVIGDSTSTADTTWPYLLTQKLAQAYPNYNVNYYRWSATNWGTISRLHTGTSGERGWDFDGATNPVVLASNQAAQPSGDWDVSCGYSYADWDDAGEDNVLVSGKWGTTNGFHSLYLGVTGSNEITLNWTTTGTLADKITVTSDPLPTRENGAEYWVRATLDVNNGAGGHDVMFFTSTNRGVSWTQYGTTFTGTGTTTVASGGGHNWALGGHQTTNHFQGKIYRADIRNGINGPSILPLVADGWSGFTSTHITGSPELNVINGSISGSSMSNWMSFPYYDLLLRNYKPDVVFINLVHNSTNMVSTALFTQMDAVVAAIKSRLVEPHIIFVSANPTVAPANYVNETIIRQAMIADYCLRNNYGFIDTCLAFPDDPTPYLQGDGLHPNSTGQEAIAELLFRCIVP